jgi:AcrR family transcriptional regulator
MPRPRTTSDQQILSVARTCFLERGADVPTSVIAARLGISHAVLFQRFRTKEELMIAALLPPQDPPWMAHVRAGPDGRAMHAQLLEIAQQIFFFLEESVPCVAVLRSARVLPEEIAATRPEQRRPVRARREIAAWFARAIERGLVRAVEPEHAADLLMGALLVRPFQAHVARTPFRRADNVAYLAFAVRAIAQILTPSPRAARPARARARTIRRVRR